MRVRALLAQPMTFRALVWSLAPLGALLLVGFVLVDRELARAEAQLEALDVEDDQGFRALERDLDELEHQIDRARWEARGWAPAGAEGGSR